MTIKTFPTRASMFDPSRGRRVGLHSESTVRDSKSGYIWKDDETGEEYASGSTEAAAWQSLNYIYAGRQAYLSSEGD